MTSIKETEALNVFRELTPLLFDAVAVSIPEDFILRHPSGVVLEWEHTQTIIFDGVANSPGAEVVGVRGLRLWRPPSDALAASPFVWMIKTVRTRCETTVAREWTPLSLYYDVNELLSNEERSAALIDCAKTVADIKQRGPRQWVQDALATVGA